MVVSQCSCGSYKGDGVKMDFDIDRVYFYLKDHGEVYTIRPSGLLTYRSRSVHIHRFGMWTREEGIKTLEKEGKGKTTLELVLSTLYKKSGFDSVEDWIKILTQMHGKNFPEKDWVVYHVELK